jgi:hypothetical protein
MKRGMRKVLGIVLTMLLILNLASAASAYVAPTFLETTLIAGSSTDEIKLVTFDLPEEADIVFAFDLTGSMSGVIDAAKANAGALMSDLDTWGGVHGVDFDYGVMSYMDYVGSYASCGYEAFYGYPGDYPYSLDQGVTSNNALVDTAIAGLALGSGGDGPQDYTRIFYESYADGCVNWRMGAEKVLLNFGDNVPHDCDLNEDVPGMMGTWSTGGDPGRDAIMGTPDDLDLQTVLADMADEEIKLLESHSTTYASVYWEYWTGITGGHMFVTESGSWLDQVGDAIKESLAYVEDLHFEAQPGFEAWLTSEIVDGWKYDEIEVEITFTVPWATPAGDYSFVITAVDGEGNEYGDQEVLIHVVRTLIDIDIKPGSFPNSINLKNKGVIPVGILGSEDFDVTTIDFETVRFAGAMPQDKAPSYEDVNGDGFTDLVLHFTTQDTDIQPGDTGACLTGWTYELMELEGCDSIRTIPKE